MLRCNRKHATCDKKAGGISAERRDACKKTVFGTYSHELCRWPPRGMAFTGHDREYDASTEITKQEKRCENHWKCVMCIMPAIGFVRAFVDEKALARQLLYPKTAGCIRVQIRQKD
jgi:hypothetical protein